MILAPTIALLLSQSAGMNPGEATTLERNADGFVVRTTRSTTLVELDPPTVVEQPRSESVDDRALFRKDDAFVVWDARGLTIRQGERVFGTRLEEVALTPRLHSAEAVFETRVRYAMGIRPLGATRLSGALRMGSTVYLLPRWEELSGEGWLEALVSVNLDQPNAKPRLWGRFEGLTLEKGGPALRFGSTGKLVAITHNNDGAWGLGLHELGSETFDWIRLGQGLARVRWVAGKWMLFEERLNSGTRLFGRVDLASARRRTLAETRGTLELLDAASPWVAVIEDDRGRWLQNLESQARTPFVRGAGARRVGANVLIWLPELAPQSAALLSPERWETVASWRASKSEPPAARPERSRTRPTPPPPRASRPPR